LAVLRKVNGLVLQRAGPKFESQISLLETENAALRQHIRELLWEL
jgi:hypothetical protein